MTASGMGDSDLRGEWSAVTLDAGPCPWTRRSSRPASGSIGRVRHVYECPMRWADMDLLGHVNNVVYVDYLQEARVDMLRTHGPAAQTGELAEGVVVVRHEVHYRGAADVPVPAGHDRVLGDRDPGRVVHDGLRGLPRDRRGAARSTCGRRPCSRRTSSRPSGRAGSPPRRRRRWTTFLEPRGAASGRVTPTPVRRDKLGHYPVHVRFSDVDVYGHVNNVKYFEYFQEARILMTARLWKGVPDGHARAVDGRRPDRRRLQAADPVPPRAVRRVVLDLPRRGAVDDRSSPRSATATPCCRGPGWSMVFFDPATGSAAAPPEAYRERLLGVVTG